MSSRLRLVAALLVLSLFGAGVAPCAGWESTAAARHDCCVEGQCPDQLTPDTHSAAHKGPISQAQADACCAASEQQNQQRSSQAATASFLLAPPVEATFQAPVDFSALSRIGLPADSPPSRSAPLHLLFSVFLV